MSAAGGDAQTALELYEWNTAISAAILHDLAHLEVALRNAYDRALSASTAWRDWTQDPAATFPPLWRTKRVHDPAQGRKVPMKRDINIGFWRYLSSTAHDAGLWRTDLHKAFPPGTARVVVDTRVGELHGLRNRVAHHEPVLWWDIAASHQYLLEVIALIAPEIRRQIAATSDVPRLLAARPGSPASS